MIANRIENLGGMLAIATPETLASPKFISFFRRELRDIARQAKALEQAQVAALPDAFAIPPVPAPEARA